MLDGDGRVRGHGLVGTLRSKIRGLWDRRHHAKEHHANNRPKCEDKKDDENFCNHFTDCVIRGSHSFLNTHQQDNYKIVLMGKIPGRWLMSLPTLKALTGFFLGFAFPRVRDLSMGCFFDRIYLSFAGLVLGGGPDAGEGDEGRVWFLGFAGV